MSFLALTCNILADSYIRREWYPNTPDAWLTPAVRHPALAAHLAAAGADLLCLQEVEAPVHELLRREFAPLNYRGEYARKGGNKPDGCATFWRAAAFTLEAAQRVEYADAQADRPASGHIALLTVLRTADGARRLGVANTHIKWDPPKTPPQAQYGLAQITELMRLCAGFAPACDAWLLCGDFNATPDAALIAALKSAGFAHAHGAQSQAHTAAPNQQPRVIDYLFHSAALRADPIAPPMIDGATPLPGPDFPSDHLALAARFDWC